MATLYISEFQKTGNAGFNTIQACQVPALVDQTVTISGTSAQSSAFNEQTAVVRVQSDFPCFLLFGSNPTATVAKMPLAAGVPEYFTVVIGAGTKVAAITA